jgi:hypothetical protein
LSTAADKELAVSVRFGIPPFEISVSTTCKKEELAATIVELLNQIKDKQNALTESVSGIDLTKFKPVSVAAKTAEDPVEKIAAKIGVPPESLRQILRVENKVPMIIAKEKFGSPEKGAMVLIYAYQFGLDKRPTHDEVSASFKLSGFSPAFGRRTKQALKNQGKIQLEGDEIGLSGSGLSDAEEEVKRILGTPQS